MKRISAIALTALLFMWAVQGSTAQNAGSAQGQPAQSQPTTTQLIVHDVTAVNYRADSGQTAVDFKGTSLMPEADGIARVSNQRGYSEIEIKVDRLEPPSHFGPEYLTYVVWAVTPAGRPSNLGELVLDGGDDAELDDVTTQLQSFGLIVTAEPHFAVTQPSGVVVLENMIRDDTDGTAEPIVARVELLPRTQYTIQVPPTEVAAEEEDKTPFYLVQARNAVRIAKASGADINAPEVMGKASVSLQNAENLWSEDEDRKDIDTSARQAVQAAEDARLVGVRRAALLRIEEERMAAAARQAMIEAELAALQAQSISATELEALARREQEVKAALLEADMAKAEAERLRMEALRLNEEARIAQEMANAKAAETQSALADAEKERAELQAELNKVMETRETPRGLVMDMSEVMFEFGKHTLKPGAMENLTRVAEILSDQKDVKIEVEGHTDSVGTEEFNQGLSERRAEAVKAFLVEKGIPETSITARGFGETQAVASNDTPEGRQRNRRVEVIIAGGADKPATEETETSSHLIP